MRMWLFIRLKSCNAKTTQDWYSTARVSKRAPAGPAACSRARYCTDVPRTSRQEHGKDQNAFTRRIPRSREAILSEYALGMAGVCGDGGVQPQGGRSLRLAIGRCGARGRRVFLRGDYRLGRPRQTRLARFCDA